MGPIGLREPVALLLDPDAGLIALTTSNSQGFYTAGGGAVSADNGLIATVPSGACLTRISCSGMWAVETSAFATPTASSLGAYNQLAGLQWVAHGGTPVSLDTTTPSGGNWLSRGSGTPNTEVYAPLIESTDYTYEFYIPIRMEWRGQFITTEEIDVYISAGIDATRSDVNDGKLYADYYVVWATYP
jgi:hypothetical protein